MTYRIPGSQKSASVPLSRELAPQEYGQYRGELAWTEAKTHTVDQINQGQIEETPAPEPKKPYRLKQA